MITKEQLQHRGECIKKAHWTKTRSPKDVRRIKKAISDRLKGRSTWNKGKPMHPATLQALINSHVGKPSCRRGCKLSTSTRKAISDALKNHTVSATTRAKLSAAISLSANRPEVKEKIRAWQLSHPNKKFSNTSIEQKIALELTKRNISFKQNVGLRNLKNVDFFIPDYNIAIECDGCYWHGCPIHYPELAYRRERDSFLTSKFELAGIKLIRLWEHDILASPSQCLSDVLRSMSGIPAGF